MDSLLNHEHKIPTLYILGHSIHQENNYHINNSVESHTCAKYVMLWVFRKNRKELINNVQEVTT